MTHTIGRLTIVTNWHRRPVIEDYELTESERNEFDYLDWPAIDACNDSRQFVRYRGELIDLGDVIRAEGDIAADGWDGFNADSYWSGIAIRYSDRNGDMIEIGDPYGYVIIARIYISDSSVIDDDQLQWLEYK